jgi:hypothetical protein
MSKELKFTTIAIFLLSLSLVPISAFADEDVPSLPLCTEAIVILNHGIPCRFDLNPPTEFNIPELELNFNNLDQIFMGAESSGGRVISPLGSEHIRRQILNRPEFNHPFELNCQARLVLDGGKTVSYLSIQNFKLTNLSAQKELLAKEWDHFVMKGNNPNPSKKYSVPTAPKQEINSFSVKVYKNKFNKNTVLQLCEVFAKNGKAISSASCAEIENPYYYYKFQVHLKSVLTDKIKNITIKKSLFVTCRK